MSAGPAFKKSNLNKLIQTKREQYIGLLRELLAKSAESEEALQHEIAGHFRRLGCQVESIASTPNRFALATDFAPPAAASEAERESVVAVQPGTGDGRSQFVFAHSEGEPIADTDTYTIFPSYYQPDRQGLADSSFNCRAR